jgi:hypothetical protein
MEEWQSFFLGVAHGIFKKITKIWYFSDIQFGKTV